MVSRARSTPTPGMNEDTLLADDDYNDTLQLLSQPTGNQPLSRKQSTAGLMQRAAGLSALDLTLPEHLMNLSSEQLESQGLSGYEALKRMKEESSRYRLAYSDWRRGAARGAKGEATEVVQAAAQGGPSNDLGDESSFSKKMRRVASTGKAAQAAHGSSSRPGSRSGSIGGLLSPLAIDENGVALEVEMGSRSYSYSFSELDADGFPPELAGVASPREPTSPTPADPSLKFEFNPFSEALEPERTALPLCEANLPAIEAAGARNLSVPAADSRVATAHIAHIGVGGFHRSHLAFVTDVLAQKVHGGTVPDTGERWGIIGVGLMPWDRKMYDALTKQDCLYGLLLRGNTSACARVVGSIVDFVFVPEDPEASLKRLCSPSVKIISLTVTEKGYYRTVSGELDVSNALVKEDIDGFGAAGLAQPKTAFGLICTVLQRRRAAGLGPLTVFSCDNLPMNGSVCRAATLSFARAVDPDLAAWMAAEVSFPNSMVDRITPATEDEHRQLLRDEYGVEDAWPVIAEPFLQWVIEDTFVAGRPRWELAMPSDVLVTSNVEPYELMKLRLLNSAHSALSYAALLCDHVHVDSALADPDVFAYLRAYMSEVVKTLEEVQGVDLAEYQRSLLERFSNTYIKDKLSRLALDGSQKFMNTLKDALLAYREKMAFTREITAKAANWILPRDRHAGEGTSMVALALAAFMRYCNSTDLDGELLPLDDPLSDLLREHAARATLVSDGQPAMVGRAERLDATRMFLAAIFGDEVSSWGAFVDTVFSHAERLQRKSCRDVLRQCRLDQLRIIRNDMRETESKLKELRRAEALLTTESERDAALRFFNQTAFSPAGRHGSVASALPGSDGGGALPRVKTVPDGAHMQALKRAALRL